ncbi:GAF domain-containing protein [Luteolibacter sp. Populi]|uniref:GAF domain-containing protein n=1 Tax=Luteolibacter sp. Populi TaxID=3230487 RepID=UPI003465D94B
MIATPQLSQRKVRAADAEGETRATLALVQGLAEKPEELFSMLVQAVLEFSNGDSAGISLLDEKRGRFFWPAVTGGLASYIGAGTPSDFGPCGTVLDRDAVVLFSHPERHFTYLEPITPPLEEVLLVPFHVDGKAVGTIWAVIHEPGRQFDAEDQRLMQNLSELASSAYRILTTTGAMKAIFAKALPA